MNFPTREQTYQAFCNRYYDENKTLEGARDAYEWFIDPRLRCAIETAGCAGAKKCKAPCPNCRHLLRKAA